MDYGITYTGTNGAAVVAWAEKYGFELNSHEDSAPADGEPISLYHRASASQYNLSNGNTLTAEEFKHFLPGAAAAPAEPDREIYIVVGEMPYGERFGSGPLRDQEVMMSERRRDAWHEYQDALLQDVKDTIAEHEDQQARLAREHQRRGSDR